MTSLSETLAPSKRGASHNLDWHAARVLAGAEGERLRHRQALDIVPLADAAGRTLAHDLFALTDLPHYSSSAMDGWAVCGDGPWQLGEPIRAGSPTPLAPLVPGLARAIATGAPIPPHTTAIVRREDGDTRLSRHGMRLEAHESFAARPGRDIRHRGEEAAHGDRLLLAGTVLSAPRLALAAVAGYDQVSVVATPSVDLVLLGDELRTTGLSADGLVRDAFLPSLPAAIAGAGGHASSVSFARDSLDETVASLAATTAPLVITTGGTARGPADFVRSALDVLGARIVIDGVAMRPGHPVILARLDESSTASPQLLLALPGNPLAAMLAFASIGMPALDRILGREATILRRTPLAIDLPNATGSTRLVACAWSESGLTPTAWQDSAMLRGLAMADLVAVIPPGGAQAGHPVEILPLPW